MDLSAGSRTWARCRPNGPVTARGRLTPRLLIPLMISTPTERIATAERIPMTTITIKISIKVKPRSRDG